jgi:DNA-binding transcriptional ArsR family regulator
MSTRTSQADVFQAISDPSRRAMLDLLLERERPVGEIAEHFDLSFQGVSQHLGVLSQAGLVTRRKVGRYRYYRIDPVALEEVYDWVSRYRRFWRRSLARLGRYLDEDR